MSYDIYIGNAELKSEWPGEYGPVAEWDVDGMTHEDAPYKPDLTGKGNSCHPGYGQWADAMEEVGLAEAFFDQEDGLLREHPGIQPLTAAHLATFEAAQAEYRRRRPAERPGCCRCAGCQRFDADKDAVHDPTLNFNMLRLEWLVWWTRWALENCERPAMANS